MARYAETTNYDLRKPVVDSELTRNLWGTDINRNIVTTDQTMFDIDAQITSTKNAATTMVNDTGPAITDYINGVYDRVVALKARLTAYLDNPDCEGAAQALIARLALIEAWANPTITRIQRFNTGTYYKTINIVGIWLRPYGEGYYYDINIANGLIKTYQYRIS